MFYRGKKRKDKNDSLMQVLMRVSPETYKLLQKYSSERELPISRLLQVAIDNELDVEPPFNFDVKLPETPYVENQYIAESKKIFDYMSKNFRSGTGLDQLVLCRRDMGIDRKDIFLLAFRELVEKDLIEEIYPSLTRTTWKYPKTYKFYKISETVLNQERREKVARANRVKNYTEKGPLDEIKSVDET